MAAYPQEGRPPCGVSPGPVHCYGELGPFVHLQRFAEISSGGTILLYEPRCAKLDSRCTPEFSMGTDKEFLLSSFHQHECLMRQSFNLTGRHRQLAFCPYCWVINENSDMALSHVRKHLDLQFICGGCYSKSFLNEPALHKHMRTQCPSVTAIGTAPNPLGGRTPCESLTNHTRLQEVEPRGIYPPGCGPYVGSSTSSNIFTFVNLS